MNQKIPIISKLRELSQNDNLTFSLKSVLIELNALLKDPNTEVPQVAELINKDAMMAATILRSANASSFGMVKKIADVKHALAILGFSNIQKILTSKVLEQAFHFQPQELWANLWKHSLAVGIASQILCNYINPKLKEIMFTAGLLHDLGSFIIFGYLKEETKEICKMVEEDPLKRLLPVEKKVLGITHQEIGAFFAKEWNFPNIIVDSIRFHHHLGESKYKEFISIVTIANNIVKGMELGKKIDYLVEPIPSTVWGMIKIPEKEFPKIISDIAKNYDEMISFIE